MLRTLFSSLMRPPIFGSFLITDPCFTNVPSMWVWGTPSGSGGDGGHRFHGLPPVATHGQALQALPDANGKSSLKDFPLSSRGYNPRRRCLHHFGTLEGFPTLAKRILIVIGSIMRKENSMLVGLLTLYSRKTYRFTPR